MRRNRSKAQSLALAYGTSLHRTKGRGYDLEALKRRNQKDHELAAQGLQMCWQCEEGFVTDLDTCPHCQSEVVPF